MSVPYRVPLACFAAGLMCSGLVVGRSLEATSPTSVEVILRLTQAGERPAPDVVFGYFAESSGHSIPAIFKPGLNRVEVPGSARFPLTLEIDTPGWWAEPTTLVSPRSGQPPAEVELWATGSVVLPATALNSDGMTIDLPEARVVFCGCLDEDGDPTQPCGEVNVTLDEIHSRYEFEMPVGCRDLELVTEEFSAVTYDRIKPMPEQVWQLERAVLSRGGSIHGMVVDIESGRPIHDVAVKAKPQFVSCGLRDEIRNLGMGEQMETEGREVRITRTSYRGRFRLTGLEPGAYEVSFSKEGLASFVLRDVPALEESEYRLDPVEMGPGGTVEVYSIFQPCDGEPLIASLLIDQSAGASMAIESKMFEPPMDRVLFTNVAAGNYRLAISAMCGARSRRVLTMPSIEVSSRDRLLVPIDLDLPRVAGFVYAGGNPVSAEVLLEALDVVAQGILVDSDADEGFAVTLPGEGGYRATVSWSGGEFTSYLDVSSDQEEFDILAPSGVLKGIVRNRAGNPVVGATVEAHIAPDPERLGRVPAATTQSDDEGLFRLNSLIEGKWIVTAKQENRTSKAHQHRVENSISNARNIELILESPMRVKVLVVSTASTPISGAALHASWTLTRAGGAPFEGSVQTVSDESGQALLEVPTQAQDVRILSTAPGFAATVGRHSVQDPIIVTLSREGGWIELFREDGRWGVPGLPTALILFGGAKMEAREPMWRLGRGNIVPLSEGKTLRLGPMTPGRYGIALIRDSDDVTRSWSHGWGLTADMVIDVYPGQTSSLNLDF